MTIEDFLNKDFTDLRIEMRLGRAGIDGEDVEWGEWQPARLSVERRGDGTVTNFTTHRRFNWAEYTPADYSPEYDLYLVEDYYLQLRKGSYTP